MIKKVLIAEDHESASISVQKTLEEWGNLDIDYASYCDDALMKVQNCMKSDRSYDLLITDLYFEEEDGRPQKISKGTDLIRTVREVQPDLKILVFSASADPIVIDMLFNELNIDGYVRKARNDAKELKLAIDKIAHHQQHFPRHLMDLVKEKNTYRLGNFETYIIRLLAEGVKQKDIPAHLRKIGFDRYSLSSVEKTLSRIKEVLKVSTNTQLVAFCKEKNII